MTIGAVVYCRCFLEGKTTPPPVAVERIHYGDEEGWFRGLRASRNEDSEAFDLWLEDCCPHPGLIAAEFDAPWGGLSRFEQAMLAAGAEEFFPNLIGQSPSHNDGWVTPAITARMGEELRTFRDRAELAPGTVLVDSETGQEATGRGPAFPYDRVWLVLTPHFGPGVVELGFDVNGLYLRPKDSRDDPDAELFRSRRLEIRPLSPDRATHLHPSAVEYVDRDSGKSAIGPSFLFSSKTPTDEATVARQTRYVHTEQRMVLPEEFGYVVDGLERVCAASVAMNHPLFWT